MAHSSATKKARPTNDQPKTNETRKPQPFERYGTNPEVDLESIDSIWSMPKDFCRAGPSPTAPPPSQPPPRAPAPEDSDSGDMDTDLGSALSADPSGCPLSPLVLIQPKRPKGSGRTSIWRPAGQVKF
ncbi:hypothetical protein ElyMa_002387300 [Elysia marginata]|uniref:Uncharacterized protein n=1 Tax=Elysia marginata TaxID=1093978 RepID=A0AAV4GFB2_9GAST|nr:hypothetical protein ElyMa_002387300 [Elysia marginata]